MITSSRASRASSGVISGSGLAIAKMIGLGAIVLTISAVSAPLADRPKKMSAPTIASASVRSGVSTACADFHWFMPSGRPRQTTPLVSQSRTLLGLEAHRLDQIETGDARGAGAVADQPRRLDVAAGQLHRVDHAGGGDDRGAVLIVVEHRNVHQFAQALLDDETLRRLDVLQIDAAERGAEITSPR